MKELKFVLSILAPASTAILAIATADYFNIMYWADDYNVALYCIVAAVVLVAFGLASKKNILKAIAWLFMGYAVAMCMRKSGFWARDLEFVKNAAIGTPLLWLASWICKGGTK